MNSVTDFLRELINSVIPFNEEEFNALINIFKEKTYKKGELLISIGLESNNLFLIFTGIVREYTIINKDEHTLWISSQGECVVDPQGWRSGGLSEINAEAIIATHVLQASKEDFNNLLLSSV